MEILIENRQNRHRIDQQEIKKKARIILDALGSPDGELSVLFVDDEEMAKLNKTYLHRSGATNVIAFPMQEGPFREISPYLLGDVVISVDTAAREGKDSGITTKARLDQLLVHGVMHLFGFDHEKTPEAAKAMKAKEKELLTLILS
jgi:probable rRNA maturation factor